MSKETVKLIYDGPLSVVEVPSLGLHFVRGEPTEAPADFAEHVTMNDRRKRWRLAKTPSKKTEEGGGE